MLSAGIAVAALGTGCLAFAGAAQADPQPVTFQLKDLVLQPGESDRPLSPGSVFGIADGTWVFAVSAKPLTDAGASLQLPAGVSVHVNTRYESSPCAPVAGTAGVYTCDATPPNIFSSPLIDVADTVPDGTVAYYGVAFVPKGGSVTDAVAKVKTAGSGPAGGPASEGAAKVTVETREHVARNTVKVTAPDLPAGKSVTQQVTVHAVDPGKLQLHFNSAEGQPTWPYFPTPIGVKVTEATASPAGSCNHVTSELNSPTTIIWCDLPAGDTTVSYTLAAQPELVSWKVDVRAEYQILTWGAGNPEAHGAFAFLGTTPAPTITPTPTPTPTDPATSPAPTSPAPSATGTPTSTPTPTPTGSPAATTSAPVVTGTTGNTTGTTTSGTLASTGVDGLAPVVGGGLALVAGGAATLAALRRRRGSHS
ncbi:hypothetical protein ACFV1L_28880 [Kitasatospora sp. NPDC059646]|uniref:hypothetical protein n=1 Tax=Kitasatospora sp. NPDC059646 TaxID=3346893 RepID=UPI0036858051